MESLFLSAILQHADSEELHDCFIIDKIAKQIDTINEDIDNENFVEGFSKLEKVLNVLVPIFKKLPD